MIVGVRWRSGTYLPPSRSFAPLYPTAAAQPARRLIASRSRSLRCTGSLLRDRCGWEWGRNPWKSPVNSGARGRGEQVRARRSAATTNGPGDARETSGVEWTIVRPSARVCVRPPSHFLCVSLARCQPSSFSSSPHRRSTAPTHGSRSSRVAPPPRPSHK
jgi:hypothetical protein